MTSEESIIRDNVSDFSDDEQQHDFHEHENQEYSNPYQRRGSASINDLYEGLTFESKQVAVNIIKQFHFMHSFNFDMVENKNGKYVVMCSQYGNECYWRARVSFNKIRKRLDSSVITHNIVHLVKTNPSIKIKTLIGDMHQRCGYTVSYKKKHGQLNKKPLKWHLKVGNNHRVTCLYGTIVKYKTSSSMKEGDDDPPRVILYRVFWAFNPCIEGFKYCKPLVQVDEAFLTGKYHGTLLNSIRQDGSRNNFPLAFAIVESETKEAWMWFLHYLWRYVTPQPNLCIISDRGTSLLEALQSEHVGWNGLNVSSVYCIRHIASNFNK
ncbi:hypothetical protein GmHk_15G044313 [Glycine max]|nr:hypothetical protein GmHk_15G044313 [Glycine max]